MGERIKRGDVDKFFEYDIHATDLVILLGWRVLVTALLYKKLGGTNGNDREEK